jgi:hypothetical protein
MQTCMRDTFCLGIPSDTYPVMLHYQDEALEIHSCATGESSFRKSNKWKLKNSKSAKRMSWRWAAAKEPKGENVRKATGAEEIDASTGDP